MVQHCTNLPRPYSRIHIVQGTKGLFEGYPNRAYIEGRGRNDQWVDAATLLAEFEHPLWKEIAAQAQGAGHGGMDFIEDYRLIKCLREGLPTDMNVYDAAALSAVVDAQRASRSRSAAQPVDSPGLHARPVEDARRRSTSCTCRRAAIDARRSRDRARPRPACARGRSTAASSCSSSARARRSSATTGRAARVGLVRPRPHRSLRQAHRLRRRPIARRGRAARLRGRRRSARRRRRVRRTTRAGSARMDVQPGRRRADVSRAGPTTSRSSRAGSRRTFPARRSAPTSSSPATCRAPPGSAARRRSSSAWRSALARRGRPRRSGRSGARRIRRHARSGRLSGRGRERPDVRRAGRHERRRHARRQRGSHRDPGVPGRATSARSRTCPCGRRAMARCRTTGASS